MSIIKNIQLPSGTEYPVAIFRGTCDTSAATVNKVVTCPHFEASDLVKGATILVTFNYTNSGAVASLTMNVNGTGAKAIKKQYNTGTSNLTSAGELIANSTYLFQYNDSYWVCMSLDYNSGNSDYTDYLYNGSGYGLKVLDACYRYRFVFEAADGSGWVPGTTSTATDATTARAVNQRAINPFGRIALYYSTTDLAANGVPSAATLYLRSYFSNIYGFSYTFNVNGGTYPAFTASRPVYFVCVPQSDGSAKLDATTPVTQTLPSSEDGKIYIYVGTIGTTKTYWELSDKHPIYYYKDGAIREWTNQTMNLSQYNNDAGFITSSAIGTANLTIKGNNTTAATFSANASSAVSLNFAGSGGTTVTGASGTITISSPTVPNGFANVVVGSTTIAADTSTDTLTLVAGSNVTLTPDATNDKITIAATNTDTKNTAGSTDTASKIFLIGATTQAANPQTYSHDTAYVGTDGLLYSGSKVVATQEYVNGLVANATHYIGDFNAATGAVTNSSTLTQLAEKVGDMFVVSTAGTYAGTALEVGDSIIFKKAVAAGTAPTASDITFVEATVSVSNSGPTLSTSAKTIGTVEGVALTAAVDHVKTSITAKTSYPTGTTASANGGTITVRDVNVNSAGHVTGTQDRTITLSQTLPGSGTLTIKKNGTSIGTFSANASADTSVNITVPTKTSELTNDSGFLTSHQSLASLPKETFKTIKVGSTNVVADTSVDTLTLVAGSNITLTPDATNDKITIATTNTTYINVTYSEIKTLRDNGNLTPGAFYRITDYVTTTTQDDTRSVGHQFDIIVQALTTNKLSEDARAALHEGDTYFSTNNLSAWELRYALDNDKTSRFAWADPTNGKGVIYRMKDEYGNDMPYDFKNIQFKRFKITAVSNDCLNPLIGLYLGHSRQYGITIDTTDYKWYYTCSRQGDNASITSWDTEIEDGTKRAALSANIVFTDMDKTNPNNILPTLLDNVFLYGSVVFNFWKTHSNGTETYGVSETYPTDCTFVGGDCVQNTIVGWSGLIQTRSTFRRNLIVSSFRHCAISTNFQQNTIFTKGLTFCQIDDEFSQNIIGGDSNGMAGAIQNSTFGQYINQNKIYLGYSDLITNSKFGNLFARNTLDNVYFGSVEINAQNNDNYFTGKFLGMTIDGITGFLKVYGGTGGNTAVALEIAAGIRGTSGNEYYIQSSEWIYSSAAGMIPRRRIEADSNGNLIMSYWSGGQWVVKTKGRAGSTWTVIPIGGGGNYISNQNGVSSIVHLSQSAYDALTSKDASTLYIVTPN